MIQKSMKKNILVKIIASIIFISCFCITFNPIISTPVMADPGDDVPFEPIEGPTDATFRELNPLITESSPHAEQLSTPGGVVSRVLLFALPLAGMILFVLLVWGGFEILIGASGSKSIESGKTRIKAALVGFILLFSSYWMAQIVQEVFGIRIL